MAISTQTYEGAPGGMNLSSPAHEIADEEARLIIDGLVDKPGLLRRRGPVQAATGFYAPSVRGGGIAQVLDPNGTHRIAVLTNGGTGDDLIFRMLDGFLTVDHSVTVVSDIFGDAQSFPIVDSKPMLDIGTLIGISTGYGRGETNRLFMWRGGVLPDYTTGTITTTRGSTAVTGSGTSWTANAEPGMFLLNASLHLVGVVKTVTDNTNIVLEEGALQSLAGTAYTLTSVRNVVPRVAKGGITTTTDSTTVGGAYTKFLDQGLDSGTWDIFRMVDMTFIGQVSTVESNLELTLGANAAVAMNNEDYIAIERVDHSFDSTVVPDVGFLNAVYAGRQFYANKGVLGGQGNDLTNRIWYSDPLDPEALDLTDADGDYIEITSPKGVNTATIGLLPTQNAMLIFKEDETYALYGSSPSQFSVRKIADDGAFSHMSAVPYEGGAIWAGRFGIYYYDGVQVRNLANEKLGDYYLQMVSEIDPDTDRMWAMLAREHYFLFIENLTTGVAVTKNATTTTHDAITICINLRSGAFTFLTNVPIRGYVQMPANSGHNSVYVFNTSSDDLRIGDADDLFDDSLGNDDATDIGTGPDFYMESKRYSMEDGQLKKLFKQVQLHYIATVTSGTDDVTDALRFDTVLGLNETGSLSGSRFRQQTDFANKRIKFLKRSQYFGFRLYQESSSVTRVVLGPWAVGFKLMRPGRV